MFFDNRMGHASMPRLPTQPRTRALATVVGLLIAVAGVASAQAQDKSLPYAELGALGSVLRIEPGTVAKQAGQAVLEATPTEAAAGIAGTYVGYKTLRFVGNYPTLAGAALTLGFLLTHPDALEAHMQAHPDDVGQAYAWLEQQKMQYPAQSRAIEALQNRAVATSAAVRARASNLSQ